MVYPLCRSVWMAFHKPAKLGSQLTISFPPLAMYVAVLDASQVFVILTGWGIFVVVSAAVLQRRGGARCYVWGTCREACIVFSASAWLGGRTAGGCLLPFAGSC